MKKKLNYMSWSTLVLLFLGSALIFAFYLTDKNENSIFYTLPKKPSSIIIEWYEGGGMLPESKNIYISIDSSYYKEWKNQHRNTVYFDVSMIELEKLYATFRENNFNSIREHSDVAVYDRGGTSIRLFFNDKLIEKKNSGRTFLHGNSADRYKRIEDVLLEFVASKIQSKYIETSFTIDESIFTLNHYFFLSVNQKTLIDTYDSTRIPNLVSNLLPGMHEVDVRFYRKDSLDYNGHAALYLRSINAIEVLETKKTFNIKYNNNYFYVE